MAALKLEPKSPDYLYALADHHLKRGNLQRAKTFADKMVAMHPDNLQGVQMQRFLEKRIKDAQKGK
jgi:Tfp pilus assembly protein PilF